MAPNVCLFDMKRVFFFFLLLFFFGASGLEVPQEVLYRGQMIDSPLVTSLYDKKIGGWEEKAPFNSTTTLWRTEERRDALPNSKQQGPKERHLECAYLLFTPAPLNFVSRRTALSRVLFLFFFFLKKMFNQDALYLDRSCLREPASS